MTLEAHSLWTTSEIVIENKDNYYLCMEEVSEFDKFKYGISHKGQLCMSLQEAKELLASLSTAIKNYEELDIMVQEDLSPCTIPNASDCKGGICTECEHWHSNKTGE